MKYGLVYTHGGTIKVQTFPTDEARAEFVGRFTLAHLDNHDDNQVDVVFDGELKGVGQGIVEMPGE